MDQDTICIGRLRLDVSRRQLSRDGVQVRLGSRALHILSVLATATGEVVTKAELMKRVWPGQVVEDNTLQVHVSALRRVLDTIKSGENCLVTVPGRGYRLVRPLALHSASEFGGPDRSAFTLPDLPSIAVLPFQAMSSDQEQGYFADGVVEEIITALSRFSGLLVIARNSSFAYKGRAVDRRQVGRELDVRYVLEGSVRRDGDRVRVSGQLIEVASGVQLWADRFDAALSDIFGVQERLTASVVSAIAPKLEQAEITRAKRKPTESLGAYDCYLRGRASFHLWTREANGDALHYFYRAIEIDPEFASAYGMAAFCYAQRRMNGWILDRHHEKREVRRLTERAVDFGKDDAVALASAGYARLRVLGDIDGAAALVEQALVLNPNLAQASYTVSFVKNCIGQPDAALQHLGHVVRLSPIDPLMYMVHTGVALAHLLAGRYDEASSWAERALVDRPNYHPALRTAAASHALGERPEQARNAVVRLRQLDPDLRLSGLEDLLPLRRADDLARYVHGLRVAGLPE